MKTLDDLKQIHEKVTKLFNYVHDNKNYGVMEDWRSHAESVNESKEFSDDCDGFAFTMVELMLEAGFPPEDVKFIVCETETGEAHAISGCEIDGVTYITENRFSYVWDWNSKPAYIFKYYMQFDTPGQWFKVTNDIN